MRGSDWIADVILPMPRFDEGIVRDKPLTKDKHWKTILLFPIYQNFGGSKTRLPPAAPD